MNLKAIFGSIFLSSPNKKIKGQRENNLKKWFCIFCSVKKAMSFVIKHTFVR